MIVKAYVDRLTMSRAAAAHAAVLLRDRLSSSGRARIVAATGASQFDFLEALTAAPGIDWQRVELFHLDEYVGLPASHPASFRRYLKERLIEKTGLVTFHALDGELDPESVRRDVGRALAAAPIDVAFAGIGENGHLAFNDPPADFTATDPYLIVELDEACRRQQVGEGWFEDISAVPTRAISMSIPQVLRAIEIICVVPDARKANAVKLCIEGPLSPNAPASILRTHERTTLYLDQPSSALLAPNVRGPLLG